MFDILYLYPVQNVCSSMDEGSVNTFNGVQPSSFNAYMPGLKNNPYTAHCSKCKKIKNKSEFYRDRIRSSGCCSICIECTKIRAKTIKRMEYYKSEYHKAWKRKYMKWDYRTNKQKWWARMETRKLINKGILKKQNCVICESVKSEAHHPSYFDAANVIWYCHEHHIQIEHSLTKRNSV